VSLLSVMGVPKHSLPEKREKKLKKLINLYENKILILIFFFKKKKKKKRRKKEEKRPRHYPAWLKTGSPATNLATSLAPFPMLRRWRTIIHVNQIAPPGVAFRR
jgi:hypothetical protein